MGIASATAAYVSFLASGPASAVCAMSAAFVVGVVPAVGSVGFGRVVVVASRVGTRRVDGLLGGGDT